MRYQKAGTSGRSAADRRYRLKKLYNLTPAQYDALVELQGGRCFICGRVGGRSRYLQVDHDHATGAVRGLLHGRCNNRLGWYEANQYRVRLYLGKRWRESVREVLRRATS